MADSQLFTITRMFGDYIEPEIELVSAQSIENVAHYVERVYRAESDTPAMLAYPDVWGNPTFRFKYDGYSGPFKIIFWKHVVGNDTIMDVIVTPNIATQMAKYLIQPAVIKCTDPQ